MAGELHDRMRRITDPYLRERLADLEDLAGRRMAALAGDAPRPTIPQGAILLARRLGPAELLDWHAAGIAGVAIEEASPAGHAAILARALGLPAIGGTRGALDAAEQGDEAVVDAGEGQLVLRPEVEVRATYVRALAARTAFEAGWAALRNRPATTADGTRVHLMLNVGLQMEVAQLDITGAEGIGLSRTEIGMLARGSIADVAEQAATYARVLDEAAGRPVMFRTLDLGADKLLPGDAPEEENPAMGWRSLRMAWTDRRCCAASSARCCWPPADGRFRCVPDGRDGGGIPCGARPAAGGGAAGAPIARTAVDRDHARSAGADVAVG